MDTTPEDGTWSAPGRAESVAMMAVTFPVFGVQAQFVWGPSSYVLPLLRAVQAAPWPTIVAPLIVGAVLIIALGYAGDLALDQYGALVRRHPTVPPGRVSRVLLTTIVSLVLCFVWPGALLVDGLRTIIRACQIGRALATVAWAAVGQVVTTAFSPRSQRPLSWAEAVAGDGAALDHALAWGKGKLARIAHVLPAVDQVEQLATTHDTLIWRATRAADVPRLTWWLAWTMITAACRERLHLPKRSGLTRGFLAALGFGVVTMVEVAANLIQLLQAHLSGLHSIALIVVIAGGALWIACRARRAE